MRVWYNQYPKGKESLCNFTPLTTENCPFGIGLDEMRQKTTTERPTRMKARDYLHTTRENPVGHDARIITTTLMDAELVGVRQSHGGHLLMLEHNGTEGPDDAMGLRLDVVAKVTDRHPNPKPDPMPLALPVMADDVRKWCEMQRPDNEVTVPIFGPVVLRIEVIITPPVYQDGTVLEMDERGCPISDDEL